MLGASHGKGLTMNRFVLLLPLAAIGCAMPQANFDYRLARERAAGEPHTFAYAPQGGPAPDDRAVLLSAIEARKLVYTGQFSVAVADVPRAVQATKALAEEQGGYMQAMTGSSIVIRVPAESFYTIVARLEKLGAVTDRKIDVQDVTERHVDLELRLNNAKALAEKLRALLDKVQSVKDALEIEKELSRVRTEIEQLEGQLKKLNSQIAHSTITVNFTAIERAPADVKVALPFWWLSQLGLDELLKF